MANSVRKMIALMVVTTTPARLIGFRDTFANWFFIKEPSIGSCFNTDQHRAIRPVKSGKIPVSQRSCDGCYGASRRDKITGPLRWRTRIRAPNQHGVPGLNGTSSQLGWPVSYTHLTLPT